MRGILFVLVSVATIRCATIDTPLQKPNDEKIYLPPCTNEEILDEIERQYVPQTDTPEGDRVQKIREIILDGDFVSLNLLLSQSVFFTKDAVRQFDLAFFWGRTAAVALYLLLHPETTCAVRVAAIDLDMVEGGHIRLISTKTCRSALSFSGLAYLYITTRLNQLDKYTCK